MSMLHAVRTLTSLAAATLLAAGAAAHSIAASTPDLHDWSERVWRSAERGDGTTVELLAGGDVPSDPLSRALAEELRAFSALSEDRTLARDTRLLELAAERRDALEENDHAQALTLLLEEQDLLGDPADFDRRPHVAQIVTAAAEAARTHEAQGEWMPAFRLFSALHVLHEVDRAYEEDWNRLSQRRGMIGFYAPRTLYDMVSAERVAEGEPALPPYNETGATWRERIRGLKPEMVAAALKRASSSHIDHVPVRDMLLGGFETLRTMATTPELAEAIPEMRNEIALKGFLDRLNANRIAIEGLERDLGFYDIDRAMRILERINDETLNVPFEALLHEFGNGASASLDEYSQFYWPESIERANRTTQGNFKGVGIQITQSEDLELEVVTPVAGTPAFRAGIRPGDIIAEIDGDNAIGLSVDSAIERITGPAGTSVVLGVQREGEERLINFTLSREVIPLYAARGWKRDGASEDTWDWFVDPEHRIGYVRLSQFLNGATDQTRSAINDMRRQGLDALILDLRYNSGGLLNEAVDLANLFMDGGIVVTQEDADGRVQDIQRARAGRALIGDMPVVVLVNGGSASASEIVAGALQDHDKAVLVGSRTYGKGSVQRIFPLDRAGKAAFKLTTQYYKLPSGRLIHRQPGESSWGIAPDVEVRMTPAEISEALIVRRDADIVPVDRQGRALIDEVTDPDVLIEDGLDPQLHTAVLLLRAKLLGDRQAQRAQLD